MTNLDLALVSLRREGPDVSIGAVFDLTAAVSASKWKDSRFKSILSCYTTDDTKAKQLFSFVVTDPVSFAVIIDILLVVLHLLVGLCGFTLVQANSLGISSGPSFFFCFPPKLKCALQILI